MKAAPSTQFINGPGPLSIFIAHIQDGHVVVIVVDPSSNGPGGIKNAGFFQRNLDNTAYVHDLEAVKVWRYLFEPSFGLGYMYRANVLQEAQGLCSILWRLWILSSRPKTLIHG